VIVVQSLTKPTGISMYIFLFPVTSIGSEIVDLNNAKISSQEKTQEVLVHFTTQPPADIVQSPKRNSVFASISENITPTCAKR
jgi:hypothetical protein